MTVIDICDDEQLWKEKACRLITDHFNNKQEVELCPFDNAESLLRALIYKKEPADIVILDIDIDFSLHKRQKCD